MLFRRMLLMMRAFYKYNVNIMRAPLVFENCSERMFVALVEI